MSCRLKRTTLRVVVFYVVITNTAAIAPPAKALGPPVFHLDESDIMLGRIAPNAAQEFSLTVHNRGQATLIIYGISSTCGCLSQAKQEKNIEIAPGELKRFDFKIVTSDQMRGITRRAIVFKTNDAQRNHVIHVSFVVAPEYKLAVLPAKLDFGCIESDLSFKKIVTVVSPYPEAIEVNFVRTSSPFIHVTDSNEYQGLPRYSCAFNVELLPNLRPGYISESITIGTTRGSASVLVSGYKTDPIESRPASLVFEPVECGEKKAVTFVLRSTNGEKFDLLKTTTVSNTIKLKRLDPQEPRTTHALVAELTAPNGRPGPGKTSISVETDTLGVKTIHCYYFLLGAETHAATHDK
ncbi:MAG TPA: DUF1573 domain-containing protein [Sedimentisphaerales bacterium]|nr:DUF1573 domain-containing protein [Sedimentisphaerales bacterium]